MTGKTSYATAVFDALDAFTSDETTQNGIYAATRSRDGLYSIAHTQSGLSTYAAEETQTKQDRVATAGQSEDDSPQTADHENPRSGPTSAPDSISVD